MGEFNGLPDEDEDEFRFRECYEFNTSLNELNDDARCIHCKKFLTLYCPHIDEFMDEEGEE